MHGDLAALDAVIRQFDPDYPLGNIRPRYRRQQTPAETADSAEWQARAKGLLKAELKRRGVTYAQLAERLGAIGVHETEPNIRNKIARGGVTAVFLLQVKAATGARELRLD